MYSRIPARSKEIRPDFRPFSPARASAGQIPSDPAGQQSASRPRRALPRDRRRSRTRRWRSHPGRRCRHTRWRRGGHPWRWRRCHSWGRSGHPWWRRRRGHPRRRGCHPRRRCRSDPGCRWRRPCHMHRRRRRRAPQFRLQLRFRRYRSSGLWQHGSAGWRDCDPRRAGDAWSRLADGRGGSRRADGGPGTGSGWSR